MATFFLPASFVYHNKFKTYKSQLLQAKTWKLDEKWLFFLPTNFVQHNRFKTLKSQPLQPMLSK